jgi:uncharacterized membrane protein YhdT
MKRTRRKSDKKRWLILASIIALVAIIVGAYLSQTTTGIKQSSNYFSIIDPAAVVFFPSAVAQGEFRIDGDDGDLA